MIIEIMYCYFSFHDRCGIEINSIAYKISMVNVRQECVIGNWDKIALFGMLIMCRIWTNYTFLVL
jgi:hypothetical protein